MSYHDWQRLLTWAVSRLGLVWVIVVVIAVLNPFNRDSTDPSWPWRSGMSLHVDARTGCHYLGGPGGGLTPRLTPDGRHFGCPTDVSR